MGHELFKPRSFDEGLESVVGQCNGLTKEQRCAEETPVFAAAILQNLPLGGRLIVDYGCGVGRLAKEILRQNRDVTVWGLDDSEEERKFAVANVASDRFVARPPWELDRQVDLIYCIYVLQHIPAIEIREALQRMHYFLAESGPLVYCSSDYRMAVRFDRAEFADDRYLGVDLRAEVGRFFEYRKPLFDDSVLAANPVVRTMVTGGPCGLAHPALVYAKRKVNGPLFG